MAECEPIWRRLAGYLAALASGLIMGVSWVVFKLQLNVEALGPADVNWLNMLGVGIIIVPVYLIRYRGRLFPAGQPYPWLLLFAVSAAGIFYLRNVGVDLTGATTSAIVARSETAFVFILTYVVLRERVRALGWLGTVLLLVGALHTVGIGSTELSFPIAGVIALIAAALLIALNALIIKLYFGGVRNEMAILASAVVQTVIFSVVVPVFVGLDGLRHVLAHPPLIGLIALAAATIVANLFLYYYAMKRAPMWAVRVLALVAIPTAVAGDYFVLGAPITMNAVQGMLLVIIGALVIIQAGRGRATAEQPC